MAKRVIVAVVGGTLITCGMLLGMSGFVDAFRERDGMRYFYIGDILPRPERGRPERPADAARRPERRTPAYEGETGPLNVEMPVEPEVDASRPEAPRPTLPAPEPPDER